MLAGPWVRKLLPVLLTRTLIFKAKVKDLTFKVKDLTSSTHSRTALKTFS